MALIKCPECGKQISNKADKCINCGFPLTSKVIEWDIEEETKKEQEKIEQEKQEFLESLSAQKTANKNKSIRKNNAYKNREKGKRGFKHGCLIVFSLILVIFFIALVVGIINTPKSNYQPTNKSYQSNNNDVKSKNVSNTVIKYSKSSLNVRKRPNEKSRVLKVLKPNEKVTTKGEQKNGFTQILNSNNRNLGWCASKYLQDSPLSKNQLKEIELRKIEAKEKRANAWKNIDNSIGAWTIVTMAVKESLVSPSTAKFPWSGPSEHVTRNGQVYTVKSYVDSQNAFGAMIRTHFTAKVKQTRKDDWTAISFEIH